MKKKMFFSMAIVLFLAALILPVSLNAKNTASESAGAQKDPAGSNNSGSETIPSGLETVPSDSETTPSGSDSQIVSDSDAPQTIHLDFHARCILTGGYFPTETFPQSMIIYSKSELQDYYNEHKETYGLGSEKTAMSHAELLSFYDTMKFYDDDFFKDHLLILAHLEEPSGSIRHNVSEVSQTTGADGKNATLNVLIDRLVPEVGTCDMAYWHILVEVEKDSRIDRYETLNLLLEEPDPYKSQRPKTASVSANCKNAALSLIIPEGWEYELFKREPDDIGILYWPQDHREYLTAALYISEQGQLIKNNRSDCPTEQDTVAGHAATVYYIDGIWREKVLEGTPDGTYCVIDNEGISDAPEQFIQQANEIANTLSLSVSIISKSQAIAIAKTAVTISYSSLTAEYDIEKGVWKVAFFPPVSESGEMVVGGDQVIMIDDLTGRITEIIYGE